MNQSEMGHHTWRGNPDWRSLREPSWLMLRGLSKALNRWAGQIRGDVLDYGCGGMPYRRFFTHCTSYVGADFASNCDADMLLEPGKPLPLDSSSVDAVISTQVLEHVRDPGPYLAECRRVLRPEGWLLLSTHGFYTWHGPGDWRRWTHEGLIYDIESAGFQVLDLDAICVQRAFFLQFMNHTVFSRLLNHSLTSPLGTLLVSATNALGSLFPSEILARSVREGTHLGFCYVIVARPR